MEHRREMPPLPIGDAQKARAGLRARPSTPDHGCLGFCLSPLRLPPSASEWGQVLCRSDSSQRPPLDTRRKHWDSVSAIVQPEPFLVLYNGGRPDRASQSARCGGARSGRGEEAFQRAGVSPRTRDAGHCTPPGNERRATRRRSHQFDLARDHGREPRARIPVRPSIPVRPKEKPR